MNHIRQFKTYGYIKRAIMNRYGDSIPMRMNDILSADLIQAHLQQQEKITIKFSDRLAATKIEVYEPLFTTIFYTELVAFVDAQRQCGLQIKKAVENFMNYRGITEDELCLKTALKVYDRYRLDK